jgi:hypothetical protein
MHNLFARSCLWMVVLLLAVSALASAQVRVAISFGPPPLPVYEQPPCPAEGYMWVPGYWAYDYDVNDYYWVPGTWVMAPEPGLLWTPGYWAWNNDRFMFHEGYWGRQVGFYGGVNYGYGYFGHGYEGGRWDRDHFYYNRSVTNVNTTVVRNVYNTTVINKTTVVNRVSYNGGNGGITARPTREEESADRERHIAPPAAQVRQVEEARRDPQLRAASNRGKPPVAATVKPAAFHDSGAVQAREAGGPYHPREDNAREGNPARGNAPAAEPSRNVPRPGAPSHARDVQPHERPPAPNSGDTKRDQKYQKEDDKLYSREQKDHAKLQQHQDKEDQRVSQRPENDASRQQMEQKHQQQTEKMEQKHDQQMQKLEQKQRPPAHPQAKPPNAEPPH